MRRKEQDREFLLINQKQSIELGFQTLRTEK